jgi:hypothetical protein
MTDLLDFALEPNILWSRQPENVEILFGQGDFTWFNAVIGLILALEANFQECAVSFLVSICVKDCQECVTKPDVHEGSRVEVYDPGMQRRMRWEAYELIQEIVNKSRPYLGRETLPRYGSIEASLYYSSSFRPAASRIAGVSARGRLAMRASLRQALLDYRIKPHILENFLVIS